LARRRLGATTASVRCRRWAASGWRIGRVPGKDARHQGWEAIYKTCEQRGLLRDARPAQAPGRLLSEGDRRAGNRHGNVRRREQDVGRFGFFGGPDSPIARSIDSRLHHRCPRRQSRNTTTRSSGRRRGDVRNQGIPGSADSRVCHSLHRPIPGAIRGAGASWVKGRPVRAGHGEQSGATSSGKSISHVSRV